MDTRTDDVARSRSTAIFRGTRFSHDEIRVAIDSLVTRAQLLQANMKTLTENFDAEKMVGIKLASENIAAVAGDAKKGAAQIEALAASLAGVFQSHVNRRSRA